MTILLRIPFNFFPLTNTGAMQIDQIISGKKTAQCGSLKEEEKPFLDIQDYDIPLPYICIFGEVGEDWKTAHERCIIALVDGGITSRAYDEFGQDEAVSLGYENLALMKAACDKQYGGKKVGWRSGIRYLSHISRGEDVIADDFNFVELVTLAAQQRLSGRADLADVLLEFGHSRQIVSRRKLRDIQPS